MNVSWRKVQKAGVVHRLRGKRVFGDGGDNFERRYVFVDPMTRMLTHSSKEVVKAAHVDPAHACDIKHVKRIEVEEAGDRVDFSVDEWLFRAADAAEAAHWVDVLQHWRDWLERHPE